MSSEKTDVADGKNTRIRYAVILQVAKICISDTDSVLSRQVIEETIWTYDGIRSAGAAYESKSLV